MVDLEDGAERSRWAPSTEEARSARGAPLGLPVVDPRGMDTAGGRSYGERPPPERGRNRPPAGGVLQVEGQDGVGPDRILVRVAQLPAADYSTAHRWPPPHRASSAPPAGRGAVPTRSSAIEQRAAERLERSTSGSAAVALTSVMPPTR